jgi:6-phosphofructokinase 1
VRQDHVGDRAGRHFSIVVVAEGAFPKGGRVSLIGDSLPGESRRLGGLCEPIAREIKTSLGRKRARWHWVTSSAAAFRLAMIGSSQRASVVRRSAPLPTKWGHMVALIATS